MERENRAAPSTATLSNLAVEPGPAVRDAAAILTRAAEDDAAANAARERYRTEGMAILEPDARLAPLLDPGEELLATRRSALVDRRQPAPGPAAAAGVTGDLYLTSRRLVLVGRIVLSFGLEEIAEAALSGERLLLVMRSGEGVSLGVAGPRLLRVEIATARAATRG